MSEFGERGKFIGTQPIMHKYYEENIWEAGNQGKRGTAAR